MPHSPIPETSLPPWVASRARVLRHCLDVRICLISRFGTRPPGHMSPKSTIDESTLRPYAHLPTSRTSSSKDCIALPCRLGSSSPLLKVPTIPSSPSSRDSADKAALDHHRLVLAMARATCGLRSLQTCGLEPATRREVGSPTPSESGKGPIETTACYVVCAMIDRRAVALHQTVLFRLVW